MRSSEPEYEESCPCFLPRGSAASPCWSCACSSWHGAPQATSVLTPLLPRGAAVPARWEDLSSKLAYLRSLGLSDARLCHLFRVKPQFIYPSLATMQCKVRGGEGPQLAYAMGSQGGAASEARWQGYHVHGRWICLDQRLLVWCVPSSSVSGCLAPCDAPPRVCRWPSSWGLASRWSRWPTSSRATPSPSAPT